MSTKERIIARPMSRILLFALVCAIFGCGVGIDEIDDPVIGEDEEIDTPQSATISLSGTVVDSEGAPLSGVEVIELASGESATTDATGAFLLELSSLPSQSTLAFEWSGGSSSLTLPEISPEAESVSITVEVEQSSGATQLLSITESDGTPTDPGAGTPQPTPTPGDPGNTDPFDENGNTTSFGIPTGQVGNISKGKSAFQRVCADHHPANQANRYDYQRLKRTSNLPQHNRVNFDLANLVAYLNRNNF